MGKLVPNLTNLLVVIFVALGSASCAYGMSVIGAIVGQPSFYKSLNLAPPGAPGYGHTANLLSAFTGVNSAGSVLGAGFTAWFSQWAGRKRAIQAGAVVLIVGGALCAGSVNIAMFIVARIIAGWGIGMLVTSIPMYQSEVSTPESRGFMTCTHGIMFAVGNSLAVWIGFGTFFDTDSGTSFPWRFPVAFQIVPVLILLIGSPFLPFSPRWLLQQDRGEEALEILKLLHRTKADPEAIEAKREFYQMCKQLELDRSLGFTTSFFEVFRTPSNRKRALFAFGLTFGLMFTGILVITNYGVLVYISLGLKNFVPLLLTAIYITISLPGNIFTALYIDRIGRRVLLLVGIGGCVICNIFECALQATYIGTNNKNGLNAAVFFLFLFLVFWSSCLDGTLFVYVAEIFPTHIRSQGTAIGLIGLYCGAIVVLVAGPIALNNITWRFFIVLIVPPAALWVCVLLFFPETKQRSLEEIAEAFGDKVALHYFNANSEEEEQYKAVEKDEAILETALRGHNSDAGIENGHIPGAQE